MKEKLSRGCLHKYWANKGLAVVFCAMVFSALMFPIRTREN